MTEKELSELYARLPLQFDSVLGTLVPKNLVFSDFVPGIRKDCYVVTTEEIAFFIETYIQGFGGIAIWAIMRYWNRHCRNTTAH